MRQIQYFKMTIHTMFFFLIFSFFFSISLASNLVRVIRSPHTNTHAHTRVCQSRMDAWVVCVRAMVARLLVQNCWPVVYRPSMYVDRSISSGSSVMSTSNLSCTSFNVFASVSSETKVMAKPLVPNLPALATLCR